MRTKRSDAASCVTAVDCNGESSKSKMDKANDEVTISSENIYVWCLVHPGHQNLEQHSTA